jgi:hypothetical protein
VWHPAGTSSAATSNRLTEPASTRIRRRVLRHPISIKEGAPSPDFHQGGCSVTRFLWLDFDSQREGSRCRGGSRLGFLSLDGCGLSNAVEVGKALLEILAHHLVHVHEE